MVAQEGGAGGGAGSDSVEQAGTTRLLACLAALHSVSEPGTSQSVILDQDVLDLPPTGGGGNGDARAAAAAAAEGASGDVAVQAAARLLAGRSRQLTTVTALKELADSECMGELLCGCGWQGPSGCMCV